MIFPHPLHLVEIQELVAEHVEWKDLYSCTLVCHSWSVSFRPALWRTVVVSSLGPDFSKPKSQEQLRHTRHLEIRMPTPSDNPLPTLSFLYLTSLKISPVGLDSSDDEQAFWNPITDMILALSTSTIPLSSIELYLRPGTNAFWAALLTCTTLRSLTLSSLHVDIKHVYRLWKVAQRVESITFRNATTKAASHIFRPAYRKPFFRLKHLVFEGDSSLHWMNGLSLPWLRAPNLETIRCTSASAISYLDVLNLRLEAKAATEAAAEGALFYGPSEAESRVHYERGQFRDLWQGRNDMWCLGDPKEELELYRGWVPGRRIREFECVLPDMHHCVMADVITNMEALEKFVVHGVNDAMRALAPLKQHVETLVELDVRDCSLTSEMLVMFLEQCPRLEVFTADKVDAAVAVTSQPWACASMRQLRVEFYSVPEKSSLSGFDGKQKEMMERLGGLPSLERFSMPENWYRGGLDPLKRLVRVQDVQFTSPSVEKLTVADAQWMVKHWPVVKRVRVLPTTEAMIASEVVNIFKDHGVECLSRLDSQSH
ncbi:hypothetical protein CPB97_000202 [Podila verticillata]|nr:hypothetical protein CPB97_000202 [Podila verticillata]